MSKKRKPRARYSLEMLEMARSFIADLVVHQDDEAYSVKIDLGKDMVGRQIQDVELSMSRNRNGRVVACIDFNSRYPEMYSASQGVFSGTKDEFRQWLQSDESVKQTAETLQDIIHNTHSWD